MSHADGTETPPEPTINTEHDRSAVAADLEDIMDEAERKLTNGRVRDAENERVRIKWLRAFVDAAGEYRKLVRDLEESEHEARIERLEGLVDELSE